MPQPRTLSTDQIIARSCTRHIAAGYNQALPLSNFGRKNYDCMQLTHHALSAICEFLVTMYTLL